MAVIGVVVVLVLFVGVSNDREKNATTAKADQEFNRLFNQQVDQAREETRQSKCGENLLRVIDPPGRLNSKLQRTVVLGGMTLDSSNAHHLLVESRDNSVVLRLYDPNMSDVHNGAVFWQSQPDCPAMAITK